MLLCKRHAFIPNTVTKTLICVDERTDCDFSGMIYNPFMPHPVPYKNAKGMIIILEDFFNDIDFPQAYFEDRFFLPNKAEPEEKLPKPVERFGEDHLLETQHGKLATFIVEVRFRQSASWQGDFLWVEEQKNRSFRSTLELLMCLDKVVNHGVMGGEE